MSCKSTQLYGLFEMNATTIKKAIPKVYSYIYLKTKCDARHSKGEMTYQNTSKLPL